MEAISLYELNNRIKQTLKASFADSVWITAEITEVQLNRSGHCYLQLADKREQEDSIVATARGTIWAFTSFTFVTGRRSSENRSSASAFCFVTPSPLFFAR